MNSVDFAQAYSQPALAKGNRVASCASVVHLFVVDEVS